MTITNAIETQTFDRYVFLKPNSEVFSAIRSLREYGELPAPGNTFTYDFDIASHGEWTVVRFPMQFAMDAYTFHNIVYWFLGSGPNDANGASESIGYSRSRESEYRYIVYNDYALRNRIEGSNVRVEIGITDLNDCLFGVDSDGDSFAVDVPMGEKASLGRDELPSLEQLLLSKELGAESMFESIPNWVRHEVVFNEVAH